LTTINRFRFLESVSWRQEDEPEHIGVRNEIDGLVVRVEQVQILLLLFDQILDLHIGDDRTKLGGYVVEASTRGFIHDATIAYAILIEPSIFFRAVEPCGDGRARHVLTCDDVVQKSGH
jgi:hypothetical protein